MLINNVPVPSLCNSLSGFGTATPGNAVARVAVPSLTMNCNDGTGTMVINIPTTGGNDTTINDQSDSSDPTASSSGTKGITTVNIGTTTGMNGITDDITIYGTNTAQTTVNLNDQPNKFGETGHVYLVTSNGHTYGELTGLDMGSQAEILFTGLTYVGGSAATSSALNLNLITKTTPLTFRMGTE